MTLTEAADVSSREVDDLRQRLGEAEETLRAIRYGEVDGLMVSGPTGLQVYTLQGAEHPYRLFIQEMSEGAITVRADGLVLFCNRRFAEFIDQPVEAIVGQNIGSIPGLDLETWLAAFVASGDPSLEPREISYVVDGGVRVLNFSGSRTGVDGTLAILVTDVTEPRKREADLRRSNEDLEQFAYVASHDLQEPLRMVASYTQLLAERYRDKLDQDANEFIGFAVSGAQRMQQLINGLLTYSRVGTRGKPLQPVDSEAALRAATANLRSSIEESEAVITNGDLPAVLADEVQLVQLFQNLFSNGIKFHRPGVAPAIHVSASAQSGCWVFSVRDNGIGIPPELQSQLFLMFKRLHARDRYPGTGIGLAICRRIVERHGGQIWMDSEESSGTTVHFTLPARRSPEQGASHD